MTKTKILCIFDGFGIGPESINNCISRAKMPNFRRILKEYYWTTLDADGESVGQESGLVGNSEVGHMNIGGLQLVPQLSYQITQSAKNSFAMNPANPDQVFDPTQYLLSQKAQIVHLIGLFSTGAIHSDLRHLVGAIESAGKAGASQIVLHLITDGRDSDRKSLVKTWQDFVANNQIRLNPYISKIVLGSVAGRFYAMDRDKNLDRIQIGLGAILGNDSIQSSVKLVEFGAIEESIIQLTEQNYTNNIYDETLKPTNFYGPVEPGQTIWLLNFRSDRMKQITTYLDQLNKENNWHLDIISMNDYGLLDINYQSIFKTKLVQNTLAQTIAKQNQTQLHISETEKYAHVTYFLNGGSEVKNEGEEWALIPSNKVESHAQMPEMKAKEITDYIIENALGKKDYVIVNYANPDMVGHTGDISAGVESMEFLDAQFGRLLEICEQDKHSLILIADHGNMEFVGEFESGGKTLTDTEHNANSVPCVIVDSKFRIEKNNLESNTEYNQNILDLNNKIKVFCEFHSIHCNFGLIQKALEQTNHQDLDQSWLTAQDIEKLKEYKLPLWYCGLFLMNL